MKKLLKILGLLLVLGLLVAGGVAGYGWQQAQEFLAATPSDSHEERVLEQLLRLADEHDARIGREGDST